MWKTKLIKLYCTICLCSNDSRYQAKMQRLSNNFRPKFTDEELITTVVWGITQRRFELKATYNYIKNHLLDWFPQLPSYQAYSRRANDLREIFQLLASDWMEEIGLSIPKNIGFVMDSCPIIVAKGNRSNVARVAKNFCNKTYNSSRKEWYYGAKLHAMNQLQAGTIPKPVAMSISPAATFDLTVAKQIFLDCTPFTNAKLYADKAYCDSEWLELLKKDEKITLITPIKKKKGQHSFLGGDCYSTAVSAIRQPIESFFHWLNEKTNIQSASKVRSEAGLFFHVFSRFSATLASLLFEI